MAHRDTVGDDSTQNTTTSSPISNLSLLDNETDTFDRRIIEHALRDRQRMRDATAAGGVQAFKRARPRAGLSLTMENLERKNISLAQNGAPSATLGSSLDEDLANRRLRLQRSSTEESRPLNVNVPQQWGRKGRQKNEFLRRLSATSPPNNPDPEKAQDPDAIWQRRTVLTGDSPRSDVDWTSSSLDPPVHPVDRESPLRKGLTYVESGLVGKRKSSIERKLQKGPDEPVIGEDYSDQPDIIGKVASNIRADDEETFKGEDGVSSSLERKGGRLPRLRQSVSRTIRNADGAVIGTTRAIFNGVRDAADTVDEHGASLVVVKSTKREPINGDSHVHRHRQHEQGSRELLKQIAASSTPSPNGKDTYKQSRLPLRRTSTPPRSQQDEMEPEQEQSQPLTREALSQHEKEQGSVDNMQSNGGYLVNKDMLRVSDSVAPKTPLVTGAWIETPATRRLSLDKILPEIPVQIENEDLKPSADVNLPSFPVVPKNPPSAAAALLQTRDHELGDSTMATLRSLLDQADDATNTLNLDDSTLDLIQHVGDPIRTAQRERAKENEMLSRMDERLRAARSGLRDASRGLKRVEKEVEEVSSALEESETKEVKHSYMDGERGCARCENITLWSLMREAWSDIMRKFYAWDRRKPWHWVPRLTWFGLICALILSWCISEVWLCEHYCHQFYGESMVGWGVNINDPRMPYVTSTILVKRPLESVWRAISPFVLFFYRVAFGVPPPTESEIPGRCPWSTSGIGGGGARYAVPTDTGFWEDEAV